MRGGAGGVGVAPLVELPQLVQRPEKILDHSRIVPLVLLVGQRACPISRTATARTGGHHKARPVAVARTSRISLPRCARIAGACQIALAQARHFEASTAFGSLQKGHVFTSAGGASLMNIFETCQTKKAMTMNAMIELMNAP